MTQNKTGRLAEFIADHRGLVAGIGATAAVVAFAGVFVVPWGDGAEAPLPREKIYNAKVERVVSGHSVKLKSDERLDYAGIRAPYKAEALHDESIRRNKSLVEGRRVRLRFDKEAEAGEGRIRAYAFTKEGFINEILVREGLAYARLTPLEKRFEKELLDAQAEARRHRRGIWKNVRKANEARYPADPKYGNFHRPSCEEVAKIKPDRLVIYKTSRRALDAGCAPCSKCLP